MVDDGYLIGYEDTNGDFVEVGRFNNQAEDTNQPVEIVHTGSGEKVELGPGGFNANNITANSVNTDKVTTDGIDLSDGEKKQLPNIDNDSLLLIISSDGQGGTAIANIGVKTIIPVALSDSFSTTEGNSTNINIYYDSGNSRFEVENLRGFGVTVKAVLVQI